MFAQPFQQPSLTNRFNLDWPLLLLLGIIIILGQFVLYSASSANWKVVEHQLIHVMLGVFCMLVASIIPAKIYYHNAVWLYIIGVILLATVLIFGHVGKGAQRWLHISFLKFQPSEIMKLACPMALSWFLAKTKVPPNLLLSIICVFLLLLPVALIAKQPDLGTAILVLSSGFFVLLLAGLPVRFIVLAGIAIILLIPLAWHFMHDYQKLRIITFLNPEQDPLGSGYNIIQSKIAIGSGGMFGHGWLNSSQAHLKFLPERTTDFIFAVFGEEFGLFGTIMLLSIYFMIISRCLYLSLKCQKIFYRLLSGSLALTFFVYVFVNISMVSGILPVVGLPLPLISYGGTSMVTILISFGVIMSCKNN